MSDKKDNTTAAQKAAVAFEESAANLTAAETAKNDALRAFTQLSETATAEQKEAAEVLMTETREAWEKQNEDHNVLVEKRDSGKTKKVKILLPVAGLFFLPYDVGQTVELPENQAHELVDAKYAEFVK